MAQEESSSNRQGSENGVREHSGLPGPARPVGKSGHASTASADNLTRWISCSRTAAATSRTTATSSTAASPAQIAAGVADIVKNEAGKPVVDKRGRPDCTC